jgi:hypothetical protein
VVPKFCSENWVYVEGRDLPVKVVVVDGAQFLALIFDASISQSRAFQSATVELVAHPDFKLDPDVVCEGLNRLTEEQKRLLRAQARGRKQKLPFQVNETALRASVRETIRRRSGCY